MSVVSSEISANTFMALIKNRRTHYNLSKYLSITPSRIVEIIEEITLHTPSAFNSQSNRLLVLFGTDHEKLWDITTDILKTIVPEDKWKSTGDRMAMFRAAAGTVLFFEERDVIENLQQKFPLYADKFPMWATESNAIQQGFLWTALESEGLGANLQHYNPLIDQKVVEHWSVSASWKLNAQLVFGGKLEDPPVKSFQPVETRVKVAGL